MWSASIYHEKGGRGLQEIEAHYKATFVGLNIHLTNSKDELLKQVKRQENKSSKVTVERKAKKYMSEYTDTKKEPSSKKNNSTAEEARHAKRMLKDNITQQKLEQWTSKPLHGQFIRGLEDNNIRKQDTFLWLNEAHLKPETESLLVAAQDQAISTNLIKASIHKTTSDKKCRLCEHPTESIQHIISSCPVLAKTDYIKRHNKVAGHIHWKLCKKFEIETTEKWYEHQPQNVTENPMVKLLWDTGVNTDRTINANRPDIIFIQKKEKLCMMIDVSIPNDTNVRKKETEKITKYKDLQIEISRMWNVKTRIVPIVIGALGTISTKFDKYLEQLTGENENSALKVQLQKIALLGTSNIIRKVVE